MYSLWSCPSADVVLSLSMYLRWLSQEMDKLERVGKGVWKRGRERSERIWNKFWILIVVLCGGRALPKAPVLFPSQRLGMNAASFPLKLLEDYTGAGHFLALPTKPSIHAWNVPHLSLARNFALSLSTHLAWFLVLFYVVGALLRTRVTFDQYILQKSQVEINYSDIL